MIAIIDYGAGNPVSVKKALDWLGEQSVITDNPQQVANADRMVLPGVGHFAATANLQRSGLQDAILAAISRNVPFLGICVGMQWMFDGSEEAPDAPGLRMFRGLCRRFPSEVKSPHVGWNELDIAAGSRLLAGVPPRSYVYFTHSFRAPCTGETIARCSWGGDFSSAVERQHIFGVQFHPEKSGEIGLQVLRNFCRA